MSGGGWHEVDAFDLPDWLGTGSVTWHASDPFSRGHLVPGTLEGTSSAGRAQAAVPCDLLAVDEAYPVPVVEDTVRRRSHQCWRNGEVLLLAQQGRYALAVPGRGFTADLVLAALARLAKAVGGDPSRYAATLVVGPDGRERH